MASDVLSGCSYGTILRKLHPGGCISVPTTTFHASSSQMLPLTGPETDLESVETHNVASLDRHGSGSGFAQLVLVYTRTTSDRSRRV
jgi:hypothetical protein